MDPAGTDSTQRSTDGEEPYRCAPGADVDASARIGAGSAVWHLAQIREDAVIGRDCVIGRGAYIGSGVHLGDGCKVQNLALVYEPAELAEGVFIGPAVVLTNDHFPRAVNPDLSPKSAHDWEPVGVICEQGASIGARAVCVAPVRIGAWSLVAAGSTVTRDVPPHALVAGSPARRIGWVGRAGVPLETASDGTDAWTCPATGQWYVPDERTGGLRLAEEATVGNTAEPDPEPGADTAPAPTEPGGPASRSEAGVAGTGSSTGTASTPPESTRTKRKDTQA